MNKKLNIWGPWNDNPSKQEYIYGKVYEEKKEEYCEACNKVKSKCVCTEEQEDPEKPEEIEECSESTKLNSNFEEEIIEAKDPYADILKDL